MQKTDFGVTTAIIGELIRNVGGLDYFIFIRSTEFVAKMPENIYNEWFDNIVLITIA